MQKQLKAAQQEKHQIQLSSAQEAQIRDIFNLFDTDGGGFIDQGELSFAMEALGFKAKESTKSSDLAKRMMGSLMEDGSVSLEEFGLLMMGEVSGHGPMEDVKAVFALLSRHDGRSEHDGLITLGKLQGVCEEFQVSGTASRGSCPAPHSTCTFLLLLLLCFSPACSSRRGGVSR